LFERVAGLTKISGEREAVILDGTNGNEFESAVRSAFGDLGGPIRTRLRFHERVPPPSM